MRFWNFLGNLIGATRKSKELVSPRRSSAAERAKARIQEVVHQIEKGAILEDIAYLMNESIFSQPPGVHRVCEIGGKKPAVELGLKEWLKVDFWVQYSFGEKKIEMAAVNMTSWESDYESGAFYLWANRNLVFQARCSRSVINEAYDRSFSVSVSVESLEEFRRGEWISDIGEIVFQSKKNEQRMRSEWANKKESELKNKAARLDLMD
jgi:hypothetical protein